MARKKGRAEAARPSSSATRESALRRNIKAIAFPVALFLVIRTFLVEAYRIPSPSMVPALLVGDWLFVNKLLYGPKVPFTDVRLPAIRDPRRGEVVVFRSPTQVDQPHDPNPTLVKRIVAEGGDTVHMRNAVLFVNGRRYTLPNGGDRSRGDDSVDELFDWQDRFALRASRFGPAPTQPTHDQWGPLVVPERHYFMMGDNRYNSKDSRYWGFVPRENVRGKPWIVYYSYNADDSDRPLPFITDIRWRRIFDLIR